MIRNPELNRLGSVFTGAASGAYTLPDAVTAAQQRLAALNAAEPPVTPRSLDDVRAALVADMVSAADHGTSYPTADTLLEVRREVDAHTLWLEAIGAARAQASGNLSGITNDCADLIVSQHLRPALLEVLTLTRAAAADTAGTDDTADALLSMPAKARNGWATLSAQAQRYDAIRNAQRVLQAGRCEHDSADEFLEMQNLKGLWPSWGSNMAGTAPWPMTTPRARLGWLLTHQAVLWLPTVAERDDLWDATYRETAARIRHQHAQEAHWDALSGVEV